MHLPGLGTVGSLLHSFWFLTLQPVCGNRLSIIRSLGALMLLQTMSTPSEAHHQIQVQMIDSKKEQIVEWGLQSALHQVDRFPPLELALLHG